jgi:ribose 5-phosphate isomerase B
MSKPIAIGSDEAGFELKATILELLHGKGLETKDFGCYSPDPVDYPDVAYDLARAVARGEHDRGILICGTGIGMAIAANKVPGVRAAQVHDPFSAERARKSNDAQIMTMGARVIGPELAKSLVDTWLASEFAGGGSARKVAKIMDGERQGS